MGHPLTDSTSLAEGSLEFSLWISPAICQLCGPQLDPGFPLHCAPSKGAETRAVGCHQGEVLEVWEKGTLCQGLLGKGQQ